MINPRRRVPPSWRVLFCGSLCVFLTALVGATPPTPPAELLLPTTQELAKIRPKGGQYTLRSSVRIHQKVSNLQVVLVMVLTHPVEPKTVTTDKFKVYAIERGRAQTELRIPLQKQRGNYRIEFRLEGTFQGREGIFDRKVLYQIIDNDDPRLMTPAQFRRMKSARRKMSFQSALKKKPRSPDIRLLSPSTTTVPEEVIKNEVRYSKRHALRVKGEGPPEELRPYIEDRTSEAWEKRDPITVRGRITFLDFDGNWRPLVNASVNLYDDDTFGDDHLGTTATDWNGNWSFSVNNDDGFLQNGRDVYYTFHLGNTRWHVRDSDGDNYVWQSATHSNVSDGSVVDYGTETGSTNPESMQIFAVINLGWNHIVVVGGQDPGHVEIRFPESTTAWFPSQELVKVQMGYSDGPDVTLHEYGHALMQYAFGGERISPGGSHSFQDKEQDEGLAYSEGWGTGYMLSVCPDGEFNWHEGADEDPGEWPTCTVQNDFGQEIELFSNTDNRKGEKNEGRVAAAMSDFRDFPNDDNGGNEDRGRNGESDQNVSNRISLATIYRDNMWGFVHEGFLNFWISLAGSLSGTTSDMAGDIMQYNWMSLPIEISCVASKIVTRDQRDQDGVLEGLRTFRDHALKPLGIGRQWMQTYYRHSPELAMILIGDEQARHAGLAIVRHFSEMGHTIRKQEAFGKLLERDPPLLPQKVQEAIAVVTTAIQKKGSKELKKELSEFHRVLSSFKRLSLVDAIRVGEQLKKRQQGRPLKVVNPASLSPASREVDWRVIRKNLSRSRIPAVRNPDRKK